MSASTILVRGLLALGLLISPACLSSGSGQAPADLQGSGLHGVWGGEGIRVTLTGTNGAVEFDCGSATIENLTLSRSSRRFRAAGKIFPATGGPAIYPPPPGREPRAIKLRGRLTGEHLRLVMVHPKPRRPGEARRTVFQLDQGNPGRLTRCR